MNLIPRIFRVHRSVGLVAAATALSLLGDQALYVILPGHYEALAIKPWQVGVILSANRWIRLLTNHFAERLTHRFNATRLLMTALLLGAVLTGLYAAVSGLAGSLGEPVWGGAGWAVPAGWGLSSRAARAVAAVQRGMTPVFLLLVGARMLWGLCWSVIRQVGVMTSVDATQIGHAARVIGAYGGLSRLGSAAGMLIGGVLFDVFFYHVTGQSGTGALLWTFCVMSVLSLPALIPGAIARRGIHEHHSAFRARSADGRARQAWSLLACGFIVGCVGPGIIMSSLGLTLRSASAVTGAVLASRYVMNALVAPPLGALQDRIGHRNGAVACMFLAALAMGGAALADGPVATIVAVVAFFLCATSLNVVLMTEAGHCGSRVFAGYATATDLGAATGPILAWAVLQFYTQTWITFVMGMTLYAAGTALAVYRLIAGRRTAHGRAQHEKISSQV